LSSCQDNFTGFTAGTVPVNAYIDSPETKSTAGISVKLSHGNLGKVLQIVGLKLHKMDPWQHEKIGMVRLSSS